MTGAPAAQPGALPAPALRRRLACLVYEGVLLFGVVIVTALLLGILTQQQPALQGPLALRVALFLVLGLYFVLFWTRSGQTLAMKTWKIRVLRQDGSRLPVWQASCRYLTAWMWFLPALLTADIMDLRSGWSVWVSLAAGVLVYAGLTWLHPDRQYWHDALCRTRLVQWSPPAPPPKP